MARILVVDDETPNRALIRAYMARSGHELIEASSGARALELAAAQPPDLVLLDVLMPGMDGFAAAERLKGMTAGEFVPIILVTALSDQDSRRRGLAAGADDFLTKPVDPQELSLRVRNLLALREHQRVLCQRNRELVELQHFKDELIGLAVHDFKSPLTVVQAGLDFALSSGLLEGEPREALEDALFASRRLLDLVGNLIETRRLEEAEIRLEPTAVEVDAWLGEIVSARQWEARERGIAIECRIEAVGVARFDSGLMARAVDNLVDNAIRHTPRGGRVVVSAARAQAGLELRVGNTGPRIPDDLRERIFEKYGRKSGQPRSLNLGLGLYLCRLAAEAHGGRAWLQDGAELPTVFALIVPDVPAARLQPDRIAS
jgi:two-component system, sensor histidine kinase and response regulator